MNQEQVKSWLKKNQFKSCVLSLGMLLFVGAFFIQQKVYAYGDCSQYGFMATYDYLNNGCKCMSGYVFGKDVLGNTTCVSGSSVCYDKYGYGSEYDSLSGSCECSYGYVFGKDIIGRTQCISEDQACKNQYGLNAKSALGGKCECRYGYGFGKNSLGETVCMDLDSICQDKYGYNAEYDTSSDTCSCRSGYELTLNSSGGGLGCMSCINKYGTHSSYSYIDKKCGCDSGYTLNESNQCVEKQNNVYFILKELDTDTKRAIVKSDYDYQYYLITYNAGCYPSSFQRYLNNRIVINLGTDFDLYTWDKIVLQDDDETCDITSVGKADSDTTLEPEQEKIFHFPSSQTSPLPVTNTLSNRQPNKTSVPQPQEIKKIANQEIQQPKVQTENSSGSTEVKTASENKQKELPWFKKVFSFFSGLFK